MPHIRIKDSPYRYWVRDRDCIGCACCVPGPYYHRGATMAGSRSTGDISRACLTNHNHGCPPDGSPATSVDRKLLQDRKAEGWRNI